MSSKLHSYFKNPKIFTIGIFILVSAMTILVVNEAQNRTNLSSQAQASSNDGPGGWCNPTENKGCGGDNGCRHWEKCSGNSCIDTTNGGKQQASSDACGQDAFSTVQSTPTQTLLQIIL